MIIAEFKRFDKRRKQYYEVKYLDISSFRYDQLHILEPHGPLLCIWEFENDFYIPYVKYYLNRDCKYVYTPCVIKNRQVFINDQYS